MFEHFFDYKYVFEANGYDGRDLLSPLHLTITVVAIVCIGLLAWFLRKTPEKKIRTYMKILFFWLVTLEVLEMIWENIGDGAAGFGYNYAGNLPLYTCSLFFMMLPFAAWGKGIWRRIGTAFITNISLFAGFANFVYLNALRSYPFFSMGAILSFSYHFWMVFTAVLLLATGYHKPAWSDILHSMYVIWAFSVIVIPANFIIYKYSDKTVDYMLYMHGNELPVLRDIANFFADRGMLLVFSLIAATLGYGLVSLITYGIVCGISAICRAFGKLSRKGPEGKEKTPA